MDNRRKTVVINSRFQYQYALLAAAVAVLLVNLTIITHALLAGYSEAGIFCWWRLWKSC